MITKMYMIVPIGQVDNVEEHIALFLDEENAKSECEQFNVSLTSYKVITISIVDQ